MTNEEQTKTDEERAWEATPNMVVMAIAEQAESFYSEGRLDRAGELTKKLVRMRPESSYYWTLLGVIHRRREETVQALQALQRAAELDASNKNALVNLGETLVIAGKVPEGAEMLRAVFEMGYDEEMAPEDHDVYTKRAGAQLAILQKVVEGIRAEAE